MGLLMGQKAAHLAPLIEEKHKFKIIEHPAKACYEARTWDHKNCFLEINSFLEQQNELPINF